MWICENLDNSHPLEPIDIIGLRGLLIVGIARKPHKMLHAQNFSNLPIHTAANTPCFSCGDEAALY